MAHAERERACFLQIIGDVVELGGAAVDIN
jgi:hypothetical protein